MGEDTEEDTTDMVSDTDTAMDTPVISARGPLMLNLKLMPNQRLKPLLMLTMDTMAVDTDTDMVMDMDMVSVMAVTTAAMADTAVDTDMVDTAVTTVRSNLI